METVLITGGSGMIGTHLSNSLLKEGFKVSILSRSKKKDKAIQYYQWDPYNQEIDDEAINTADYIVNLAGAGLADKRWTKERKVELYNSRILSTLLLRDKLKNPSVKLKAFISASATGYYGDKGEELLKEDASPGKDFLANICKDWEAQAGKISELGIRVVINRSGVVLSKGDGILAELEKPMDFGLAPFLGDGRQFYSWIHIDDIAGIILHEIKNDIHGAFNAVTPHPVRNKDLIKAIVKAKKSHALVLPSPELAIKLALGEMSQSVLGSQQCSSEKIEASGYHFLYPDLDEALKEIYSR